MSRDNVSSEQNKASIEWEAYDEWERWNEIKKTSLEHMEKLIKKGGLGDLKKMSLKLYLGKKPQKRSHLMMKALSGTY